MIEDIINIIYINKNIYMQLIGGKKNVCLTYALD